MHAKKRRAGGYNVHVDKMPTIGISNSFGIEQILFIFWGGTSAMGWEVHPIKFTGMAFTTAAHSSL